MGVVQETAGAAIAGAKVELREGLFKNKLPRPTARLRPIPSHAAAFLKWFPSNRHATKKGGSFVRLLRPIRSVTVLFIAL